MTGNFKIRAVENHVDTHGTWFIHEDNIEINKTHKRFHHLNSINRFISLLPSETISSMRLFSHIQDSTTAYDIYEHDIIRKLTVEEYLILSNFLRRCKRKYNKKKDILI